MEKLIDKSLWTLFPLRNGETITDATAILEYI